MDKLFTILFLLISMSSFANSNHEKISFETTPTEEFSSFGKGAIITDVKYNGYPIVLNRSKGNIDFFKWLCEKADYMGEPAAMVSIVQKASLDDVKVTLSDANVTLSDDDVNFYDVNVTVSNRVLMTEATGLKVAMFVNKDDIRTLTVKEGTMLRLPISFGCREYEE